VTVKTRGTYFGGERIRGRNEWILWLFLATVLIWVALSREHPVDNEWRFGMNVPASPIGVYPNYEHGDCVLYSPTGRFTSADVDLFVRMNNCTALKYEQGDMEDWGAGESEVGFGFGLDESIYDAEIEIVNQKIDGQYNLVYMADWTRNNTKIGVEEPCSLITDGDLKYIRCEAVIDGATRQLKLLVE
jgi:hypothetical protein